VRNCCEVAKITPNNHATRIRSVRWNLDGSPAPTSTFLPIPDLVTPEADVLLVFLSANDIYSPKPIDDEWYAAHWPTNKVKFLADIPHSDSLYVRDEPVRVLGCTTQYQYCNPNVKSNTSCTPMGPFDHLESFADSLWQTERQKALFKWSAARISEFAMRLKSIISMLGVSSLTSRYSLTNGLQGPLPDNQWQKEVEFWFTATLADLQRATVEVATGPKDADVKRFLLSPKSPEQAVLCRSQVGSTSLCCTICTVG
jgi:hypothetical protein